MHSPGERPRAGAYGGFRQGNVEEASVAGEQERLSGGRDGGGGGHGEVVMVVGANIYGSCAHQRGWAYLGPPYT